MIEEAALKQQLFHQVEAAFRGIYRLDGDKRHQIITQMQEELRRSVDADTAAGMVMLALDNEQEGRSCNIPQ